MLRGTTMRGHRDLASMQTALSGSSGMPTYVRRLQDKRRTNVKWQLILTSTLSYQKRSGLQICTGLGLILIQVGGIARSIWKPFPIFPTEQLRLSIWKVAQPMFLLS